MQPSSPGAIAVDDYNASHVPIAQLIASGHASPHERPALPAEMQDALFEEAMDQVVGNYSIVLNFNS